ncbi:hypothetical protein LTR85_007763 [Meristemomyces frigidus]|nr:hypothetical protein LTR85_007763 [Meristemomyces frigidus]
MHSGLRDLWESKVHSDLIITCRGLEIKAHRNIVEAQSKLFAHLGPETLHHGFTHISHDYKRKLTYVTASDTQHPAAIEAMIKFFYTGDLDKPCRRSMDWRYLVPALDILRYVFQLALKYQLPDLKALAMQRYCEALTAWSGAESPEAPATVLAEALKETFGEARDVFELREATLEAAARHSKVMLQGGHACWLMVGEPMRALAMKLSERLSHLDDKAAGMEALENCEHGRLLVDCWCRHDTFARATHTEQ